VDVLSEVSSTDKSVQSSFWESSDADSSELGTETDILGSLPAEIAAEPSPSESNITKIEFEEDNFHSPCEKIWIDGSEVGSHGSAAKHCPAASRP
jgi:hypothetical protein